MDFVGDGLLIGFVPNSEPLLRAEGKSEPISWLNYDIVTVTENSAIISLN